MVREHREIVLERPAIACQEYILYRYRIVRLLSSTLIFTIAGHDQHQRKLDGGYRAASFREFRDRGRYHINLSAFDLSVSKSKTFTGAVYNPAAKLSDIIRDVLCNFTDTLETFMLRLKGNNGVETLSHSAVRIFGHCRRLKNFLFNSRICIARPDWWVLHRLYNKVDRAIFLRLSYRPLKVEKNFWVRDLIRLTEAVTDWSRQRSETTSYQTMMSLDITADSCLRQPEAGPGQSSAAHPMTGYASFKKWIPRVCYNEFPTRLPPSTGSSARFRVGAHQNP